MSLPAATRLAEQIAEALSSACERILIAGSVRRRCEWIGDIEILAIPIVERDLLGSPAARLVDSLVKGWLGSGRVKPGHANGERYKSLLVPQPFGNVPLDLYLCTPERWGVLAAIRTGPVDYAKAIVTQTEKGGLLQSGLFVRDGLVYQNGGGRPVPTRTEREYLDLAGGWVEPEERAATIERLSGGLRSSPAARDAYKPVAAATTHAIAHAIRERGPKGATCEEIAIALGLKHQTASPLITKLRRAGQIEQVGSRPTSSGRSARVYRIRED